MRRLEFGPFNPAYEVKGEDFKDDDGDLTFEDREEEEDEKALVKAERAEGHKEPAQMTPVEMAEAIENKRQYARLQGYLRVFGHWQDHWNGVYTKLMAKMAKARNFSPPSLEILGIIGPDDVFTTAKKAMFRALATTKKNEWYNLPGHADWWPEDYDYAGNGWDVGMVDCGEALLMEMLLEKYYHEAFPYVDVSADELILNIEYFSHYPRQSPGPS